MTDLVIDDVSLRFGGVHALRNVSATVHPTGVTALIGPNGAGKTSLVNVITSAYQPTSGQVRWKGVDLASYKPHELPMHGIARTFQNLEIFGEMTVLENVMTACQARTGQQFLASLIKLPSVARLEHEFEKGAMAALARVALEGDADRPAGDLPYGHLKQLEIARALALQPELLLMDEPAAGCNPNETEGIAETIRHLSEQGTGILLIEHDMKLVMEVSDRIIVLERGAILADGTPEEIRSNQQVIDAYLGPSLEGLLTTETSHPAPQQSESAQC